ncbi:MAG: hypothetical protein JST43_03245 [Bacteroidetes bacterium]|nr:hypothetical protein [Bacteroidota bacterium]MBS1540258.1 hypothetical protein [Bacteroidota bacterium]
MDTLVQQKKELVQLIQSTDDVQILESIKNILKENEHDRLMKERLIAGALKSQEDIKNGRLFSKDEVIKITNRIVGK